MTISRHKRPDGRIAFRVQLDVEGERKSYGLFDDREAAERAEAAQLATLGAESRGATLGKIGERFIEAHEAKHRGAGRYRSLWRHYVAASPLARMELAKVRLPNVVSWLRRVEGTEATATKRGAAERVGLGRPISRQTVAHAFHLLRSFFAWAIREGKARQDPTADVRLGDATPPPWTWLRSDEIAAVLALPSTASLSRDRHGREAHALTPAQRSTRPKACAFCRSPRLRLVLEPVVWPDPRQTNGGPAVKEE